MATLDSMGVTPQGVLAIAHEFGISDIQECYIKVQEFVTELRKLKENEKKSSGNKTPWQK